MVICIAIFDSKNKPLYLKCVEREAANLHEISLAVYCSLDVICEDKDRTPSSSRTQELYVGLLLEDNKKKLYGFLTNTNHKIIFVFEQSPDQNFTYKDHDIRVSFSRIHNALCYAFMNPFYNIGEPLDSKILTKAVNEVLSA
uniref:Trafficking protein particle complex subunit 2-like protein n=1 Tax=Parastrongyloides trichosuri TaxID=131310 RepID=A0A0N4ZXA7_PARTI